MEKFIIVSANFCQSVFEKGFLQDEKDIQCLSPAKKYRQKYPEVEQCIFLLM